MKARDVIDQARASIDREELARRHLYARVVIDRNDPVARRDYTMMLIALLRLRDYGTPAARRRAYRRIPKIWSRAIHREMQRLIDDLNRMQF